MESLVSRMIRAMKLDRSLYEEVEADETATRQALTVVVLASVSAGIGNIALGGVVALVVGLVAALLGWVVWAGLAYVIGTRLLPEPNTQADLGQLLRTTGFAAAPGVLNVVGGIPLLGWIVSLLAAIWMLVAFVIAVRQALDYESTGRAVLVCVIGWFVYMGVMIASGMLLLVITGGMASLA